MNFHALDTNNKEDLQFVIELYQASFPPSERRSIDQLIQIIEDLENFTILVVTEHTKKIGFISTWTFENFTFLEHFAISSKSRNGGYGKKVLEILKQNQTLPLIGEIELPSSSEFAARREKFYKRLNFKIWYNIKYSQPNFIESQEAIPMLLISYGEMNEEIIEKEVIPTLQNKVYTI